MLIIPAILERFTSLKDRSLKIIFETIEPSPDQIKEIALSSQQAGYLAFSKDAFKTEALKELKELKADFNFTGKTPSHRLHNVLYVYWNQDKKGYDDFQDFYKSQMEIFINDIKSKLL